MEKLKNEEWKEFMLNLSAEELFGVTSVRKLDSKGDTTLEQIAKKSLSLPSIDFEYDPYVGTMAIFIEQLVKNPSSYTQKRHNIGDEPLVFGASDLLHYLISLQATHKATQSINDEKRLTVLSCYYPWQELTSTVNHNKFFHETYAQLPVEQRGFDRRFKDYSPLFNLDELRILEASEGLPQQVRDKLWDGAGEIIQRKSEANLGGGSGNAIIAVIYSTDKSLPAELISELGTLDKAMIPKNALTPEDQRYLSPRDYVLVQLRQNTKGMSSSPHVL